MKDSTRKGQPQKREVGILFQHLSHLLPHLLGDAIRASQNQQDPLQLGLALCGDRSGCRRELQLLPSTFQDHGRKVTPQPVGLGAVPPATPPEVSHEAVLVGASVADVHARVGRPPMITVQDPTDHDALREDLPAVQRVVPMILWQSELHTALRTQHQKMLHIALKAWAF